MNWDMWHVTCLLKKSKCRLWHNFFKQNFESENWILFSLSCAFMPLSNWETESSLYYHMTNDSTIVYATCRINIRITAYTQRSGMLKSTNFPFYYLLRFCLRFEFLFKKLCNTFLWYLLKDDSSLLNIYEYFGLLFAIKSVRYFLPTHP